MLIPSDGILNRNSEIDLELLEETLVDSDPTETEPKFVASNQGLEAYLGDFEGEES